MAPRGCRKTPCTNHPARSNIAALCGAWNIAGVCVSSASANGWSSAAGNGSRSRRAGSPRRTHAPRTRAGMGSAQPERAVVGAKPKLVFFYSPLSGRCRRVEGVDGQADEG